MLFFTKEISESSFLEISKIIPKSFAIDISFISYLLVVIAMLLWLNTFFRTRFFSKIAFVFTTFFIFISSLINGGEVALYSEWKTKLNFTALSHFSNPTEVFSTASLGHILTTILFVFVGIIFIRIYKKQVHPFFPFQNSGNTFGKVIVRILSLPLIFGLLLIGIRGGLQEIPINLSDAYFSNNLIINDIAVNPNWYVFQSIYKSKTSFKGNPYEKYTDEECEEFIKDLYKINNDTTILVLTTKTPNIIFVLLESWSADNIESLQGLNGITPNFKDLEKKGILFTDFYSNGWVSDQGMSSIFSSFPVFPYVAIINQADKSRKLASLNKSLKTYHSSFFFGGQLTYGNIKGYLISNGFNVVKDEEDYSHLLSGSLGVHDEYMFGEFKKELADLPQPFMSALFTISSHSPYDFPAEHKLSFDSKEDKYVNSVAYTDKCLGEFMESVKGEDWYKNTLFVIVADHSHNSPRGWRKAQKERFKIPMLWFGEVLKKDFRGTKNTTLGSHIDIVPTLLAQLNLPNKEYKWGKDLFNPNLEHAVPYAFHKGFGLIRENGYYAFSESYDRIIENHAENKAEEDKLKKEAEMYFQSAFKEYMDL
jgi:phosphoglycerol transferase MdoB-like AlkP superfamily enzyme